jgi:DNA-directed RNA polymerase specialized sigma24 family protein
VASKGLILGDRAKFQRYLSIDKSEVEGFVKDSWGQVQEEFVRLVEASSLPQTLEEATLEVVRARLVQKLSPRDISERLRVSENHVHRILHEVQRLHPLFAAVFRMR